MKRYFKFVGGNSNKFWGLEVDNLHFIIHYGRIGTAGVYIEKNFISINACKTAADYLISYKLIKGYVEVFSSNNLFILKNAVKPAGIEWYGADQEDYSDMKDCVLLD